MTTASTRVSVRSLPRCRRSALNSSAPNTRYSVKWPTGETSISCPNSANAPEASAPFIAETTPSPWFTDSPELADIQKIKAAITATAAQLSATIWFRDSFGSFLCAIMGAFLGSGGSLKYGTHVAARVRKALNLHVSSLLGNGRETGAECRPRSRLGSQGADLRASGAWHPCSLAASAVLWWRPVALALRRCDNRRHSKCEQRNRCADQEGRAPCGKASSRPGSRI